MLVRIGELERSNVVCDEHSRETALSLVQERLEALELERKKAWDTCRACAGGGFDEVAQTRRATGCVGKSLMRQA